MCGRPHVCVGRTACCPWRALCRGNQRGDRGAETSAAKWRCEPRGFEIIGRERKKEGNKNPYVDALRTVHLVGCECFTVSACLTDNMAKGIHLKHSETTNKARSESTTGKLGRKERGVTGGRDKTTRLRCCQRIPGDGNRTKK